MNDYLMKTFEKRSWCNLALKSDREKNSGSSQATGKALLVRAGIKAKSLRRVDVC